MVVVIVVIVVVVVVLDILNLYRDPPRAGLDKLRYAVSTQILVVLRERNHDISFDTEEVKEGRLPIAKETVDQCAKWGVGKDGIQPLMQV